MEKVRKRSPRAAGRTTITSKGQMTLPKAVREQLGIATGDQLDVSVEGKRIVLIPKALHLRDIYSILPAPKRPISLKEMEQAIERGATGR